MPRDTMDEDEPLSFAAYQTRRDLAALCSGMGAIALALSTLCLLLSLLTGYGPVGWLAYGIGPVSLLVSLPFLGASRPLVARARAYKERLDRES